MTNSLVVQGMQDWWQAQGEWVEPPNVRRQGESGVQRLQRGDQLLYLKRQHGHLYRSLRYPFGRPTVLRERAALNAFEALGVKVPRTVYCGARKTPGEGWRALLVTEALEGFVDLDTWLADDKRLSLPAGWHDAMLQQLAITLATVHRARWQHGCLYGKHVFVRVARNGEPEIALLDLEKCRRRLLPERGARKDLDQLRRHSSLKSQDWERLIYCYQAAFGKRIRGL